MVLDHPYFAVTDAKGYFEIKNAPAGTQKVVVWQEAVDKNGLHHGPLRGRGRAQGQRRRRQGFQGRALPAPRGMIRAQLRPVLNRLARP